MRISFLITTLNRFPLVSNAIESIENAILPDNITWEVVVIDQEPSEDLKFLCQKRGYKYKYSERRGLSFARNMGVDLCEGTHILTLDDDAMIDPLFFQTVIENEQIFSNYSGVSGRIMRIDSPNEPFSRHQNSEESDIDLYSLDTVLSSALIVRKSVYKEIGYFDNSFGLGGKWGGSEETDYLIRMLKGGKQVRFLPDLTVYHPPACYKNVSLVDTVKKMYNYGLGRGALLKKHSLPNLVKLMNYIYPLLGFLFSLGKLRLKHSAGYLCSMSGRVVGYFRYKKN